jgi:putative phosphoesterase
VIIGILSDTHDHADWMAAGIRTLQQNGAEFLVHCGDIGGEECIDLLAGIPSAFVFGNTDFERARLARYAASIDVACYGNFANLELDGKAVAVIHGDDARHGIRLLDEQKHDYLFHGHTHVRADRRVGRTRVINPGALHRASVKTVVTLDTRADKLSVFEIRI